MNMKLIQKYELAAKEKEGINIGVGLGESKHHNQKILTASLKFLNRYKSNIYLFGQKASLSITLKQSPKNSLPSQIKFIQSKAPEKSLFEFLREDSIQSIIRGSLSSDKFLKNLKINLHVEEINRLALLETINGQQFFYGPVGIDECNIFEQKIIFLELALKEFQKIQIVPKISILSGGRLGDIGRSAKVDQTIQDAEKIVDSIKNKYPNLLISHDEILIEKAVENGSNLIIAPDGISGNLIYRTLVHLGGGKAYGAIYMGDLPKTIIDTSRVGNQFEIYGGLILALALSR